MRETRVHGNREFWELVEREAMKLHPSQIKTIETDQNDGTILRVILERDFRQTDGELE